jgi:hypothetical protein
MSESIALLTNIIYENNPPIVSFSQLRFIAEDRLSLFFNEIEEMACLERKNDIERKGLDRSLAYQCYLMCWNRNRAIPLWSLEGESVASDCNFSWVDGVDVLTKLLYDREKVERKPAIYSFKQLREEMKAKDSRLSVFFQFSL